MMQSSKLLKLIILALMGTISTVLMLLDFPLPLLPAFLKVDFSDIPALIAALLFTPVAGIAVEGIKNLLHLIFTGFVDPVGAFANFFAGMLFVVPVALFYHRMKGVKSLVSGLITGTIALTLGMGVFNYFILLPIYSAYAGFEQLALPAARWSMILIGITPFNILKGIIVSMLFIPLFVKLRPWLEKKRMSLSKA